MNNAFNSNNYKTAMFADCLTNSKEIYQLIDQVFPLDACRHYEVLPLELDGSNLVLGMLDPSNEESVKFANSIAKVFKYELEIQIIDTQIHQIILASYPQNSPAEAGTNQDERRTVIDTGFNPNNPLKNTQRLPGDSPTIIVRPDDVESPQSELPNLPPDMDFLKDLELKPQSAVAKAPRKPDSAATLFEIPPEFQQHSPNQNLDDKATMIGGNPAELLAQESMLQNNEGAIDEARISALIAESLGTKPPNSSWQNTDPDFLPQLAPQLSWQELLDQAFIHNSNYIALTRHSDRGSIVASQDNDQPQSALEQVPLPIFCSLIDEIKRMARLPQKVTSHPRKVVFEKLHQQERILLRLEFCLQDELEIVNIQILRHEALEVYEQQQMDRISNQALQLAKQLEKSLRKIQACFDSAELTNLRELQTIHSRINHQLRLLDRKS